VTLQRDYQAQLAKLKSDIAAVLTSKQISLREGLIDNARLHQMASDAARIGFVKLLPTPSLRYGPALLGINSGPGPAGFGAGSFSFSNGVRQFPAVVISYLQLSEPQITAIEAAYEANDLYVGRQSVRIEELRYAIRDLTAAREVHAAKLGAAYVAIARIQSDEAMEADQLMTRVRAVLSAQQMAQVQKLDTAAALGPVISEAACNNVLVIPPDVAFWPYYAAGVTVEAIANMNPLSIAVCQAATETPAT
jgi:hypothetical protein